MSDKGVQTCPLCAEEMDFTDQQLKPCKCGYDICVWCWHHIMDMAEKDGIEGRCPACRAPYDKDKIVGMAANCGRVAAEISSERKVKSQKTRGKPSEGRKHLSSVRVVQRNLVYVVGLPLNLGDEDLLQQREYFGRYGKVLKVSLSRTTSGAIQQFPNNTCSVYITYSKEEEAARCIQSVHGFTLEGRPLRACFGTSKYCHAWLRNMPCSNPDCLYLHEIGSQVDSFTKDEIVPAHTRVLEITGATISLQCRSGNVLPPPFDENSSNCTIPPGKLLVNNASNVYPSLPSSASPAKGSPPNSSSGRPAALPSAASWGMRASSSQLSMSSTITVNAPTKQKANANGVPVPFSSVVASTLPKGALHDDIKKKRTYNEGNHRSHVDEKLDSSIKKLDGSDLAISSSDQNNSDNESFPEHYQPTSKDHVDVTTGLPTYKTEDVSLKNLYSPAPEKSAWDDDDTDDYLYRSNIDISKGRLPISDVHHPAPADRALNELPNDLEKPMSSGECDRDIVTSEGHIALTSSESTFVDRTSIMPSQASSTSSEGDEDVKSFNIQRLQDSQIFPSRSHLLGYARETLIQAEGGMGFMNMNRDSSSTGLGGHEGSQLHASRAQVLSSEYNLNLATENGCRYANADENQMKRFGSPASYGMFSAKDLGENSIISDILSLDIESDCSLGAHNLARLFSEADSRHGSQMLSTSLKAQCNNNQSRFSFAREEEPSYQTYVGPSNTNFRQPSFSHNVIESRDQYVDKVGHDSNTGFNNFEKYNVAGRNQVALSSNRLSASRAPPVSAPPGFTIPNRTTLPQQPPPGFTSFERVDLTFNTQHGNSLNHSLFGSSSEAPPTGNMYSSGDIEFMDPAILAVGKGRLPVNGNNYDLDMRSNLHTEVGAFENEARLQLLMQRCLTQQRDSQNGFSPITDNYGLYQHQVEQRQGSNFSPFNQISLQQIHHQQQQQQPRNGLLSNYPRHDGWRGFDSDRANNVIAEDLIMNERLGWTKRHNGFEDVALRMPTSADLYNR